MSIADKVLTVLADITETDEVRQNLDVQLYEQHILDSFKTIELIIGFSETFGIEISPAAFEPEQWATPRKIVAYIEREIG